jgi:uncharacterized membrane protein
MFDFGQGLFESGDGLFTDGGRVYEFSGHLGVFGIVAVVLGIILWAVVVTTLVLVIIELIRRQRHSGTGPATFEPQPASTEPVGIPVGPEALRILDERYARGEIGHDEYLARKGDLTGALSQPAQGPVVSQ